MRISDWSSDVYSADLRVGGAVGSGARGGDLGGELLAGAEAGIDQAARLQRRERLRIVGEVVRLPPHRLLPHEAQPGQVFQDRRLEFRACAVGVAVLAAEQQAAARSGGAGGEEARGGVAYAPEGGGRGGEEGGRGGGPS